MASASHKARGRPVDKRLAERRRDEILDVAARVFAQRGFSGADVQEIADELSLGKGTVYRYFPTKQVLFMAAVERGMARLRAEVDTIRARITDPLELIGTAIQAYFDLHPELVELFIQELAVFPDRKNPTYFEHQDAGVERWREVFRRLVADGRVRRMPVDRITSVINATLYGTMFTNYFAGREASYEIQAAEILEVAFCGVLSDAERVNWSAGCPPWLRPLTASSDASAYEANGDTPVSTSPMASETVE